MSIRDLYLSVPWSLRASTDFRRKVGYWPNWGNPRTFNEKLGVRKRAWRNALFPRCSDKVLAKDYVAEFFSESVIPTLHVSKSISASELTRLVKEHGSVVAKTNHGSGSVYFVTDKCSAERVQQIAESLRRDLAIDYGKWFGEGWYSQIERRVLVEPLIRSESGLSDYKFHVFDGERIVLQVDFDRYTEHTRSFFCDSLEYLPIESVYRSTIRHLDPPPSLGRMKEMALHLAQPFTYARIDLYDVDGGVLFGEMTFAHEAGMGRIMPVTFDHEFGQMWTGDPAY